MVKNRGIKAIIFDVGGVLWLGIPTELRMKEGIHEIVAKKLGVSVDQYFDSIDTTYAKSMLGEISEKEALRIMARNLKTTPSRLRRLYIDAYRDHLTLNKELLKKAEELKKTGYKVAILSDQWAVSKDGLIIKEFYKIFNPVIISCDVQLRKPDPDIYALVLRKLKVRASQAVFIDNQHWNIDPAKDMGLHVILFKNNRQAIAELEKLLK